MSIHPMFLENTKDEVRVCSHCFEEIEVKSAGDESWDYCEGCQLVEGDTKTISLEEYEARQ